MNICVQTPEDVKKLFPQSPQEIAARAQCSMRSAQKALDDLIALPTDQRSLENTVMAFDRIAALSEFSISANIIELMEYVHPDETMRQAAHEASIAMKSFFVDHITNNRALYKGLQAFVQHNDMQALEPDVRYFVQETMADFKRAGLELPDDQLAQVKSLNKELAQLATEFEANIAKDNRTIAVTRDELQGLDDDFINALKRDEAGNYVLGVDYPTYFNVREHCTVADTRKKLFIASNNRGYPANDAVLKQIIAKRDELARILGFSSYAALDIDSEMAKNPERVKEFLHALYKKASAKADREYEVFKKELPASVMLTEQGKLHPWDLEFTKNSYKKKHLQIDERAIAEYFPMEHTIQGLLNIYEQFLSLRFEQVPVSGLWHEDVQLIAAHDANSEELLGYLLLDLYPRANKYSHACHATIIPAVKYKDGKDCAEVAMVIANFPKSTPTKPSLLTRNDVNTFFHEFGHAMHGLLGRTQIACQAGTSVKRDFVEMPSQMLEEWLWDAGMLKMISKHYQTGAPLPDELIAKIQHLKHFDSGDWTQRQVYLSLLALTLYDSGAIKDPYLVQKELYATLRPHVQFYVDDHMYASFGHLTGYAARYYGYLWSKVYALDMFGYIKQYGLLDPVIGKRYVTMVIGKGGSKDPNELLKDFLGREPNDRAFIADLGL